MKQASQHLCQVRKTCHAYSDPQDAEDKSLVHASSKYLPRPVLPQNPLATIPVL